MMVLIARSQFRSSVTRSATISDDVFFGFHEEEVRGIVGALCHHVEAVPFSSAVYHPDRCPMRASAKQVTQEFEQIFLRDEARL